jgi:hypothetical protein
MNLHKNKSKISTITIILVLTFSATLMALPATNAHTPPWTFQPYLYIHVSPNPVGVNQELYIVAFSHWALPGARVDNDIRWHDFKLTITKPNGDEVVQEWDVVPDSGGSAYMLYTPDIEGTYNVRLDYPGQHFLWNQDNTPGLTGGDAAYENDTILPGSATTSFIVQSEQVEGLPDVMPPTEYWTRPINAQNFLWASVSSNWLSGAAAGGSAERWGEDDIGPRTSHVMWTKIYELGGLVGGTEVPDATYYGGFSYEDRFGRRTGGGPIIISGMLFYPISLGHAGDGGGYIAVDLRTGEELWYRDDILPRKGQLFDFQGTPNQHGTVGGILWQTQGSTWYAYDALTGKGVFNLTNVPGGTEKYVTNNPAHTNNGMIVRYVFNYDDGEGWIALWNNTLAITSDSDVFNSPGWRPNGNTIDASDAYSWNETITGQDLSGSSNPSIVGVIPGDIILGSSSSLGLTAFWRQTPDPWTIWAISDKPENRGTVLWKKDYPAPANNLTIMFTQQPIDPVTRTFIMTDRETGQFRGYSLDTGELKWGPKGENDRDIQYYSAREAFPADGKLIVSGYGGQVFAYSAENGNLLWKYNNTNSGTETPWGLYPTHVSAVAGGVVYAFSGEHSPNKPLYHGYRTRAIDLSNGNEIYTLSGWSASGLGTTNAPIGIADGYIAYLNLYDGRVYSLGKGPSTTTITAPDTGVPLGSSVIIRGTVIDAAAGTKLPEQAARFPNGVPAVSDSSMSAWMEYVYMQQPRPANVVGVDVSLDAVDPTTGELVHIATTTTDATGLYSYQWTPEDEGKYTIIATFMGTEGYWPSYAETAIGIDPALPTGGPITPEEEPLLTIEVATLIAVVVIAAVAIVGYLVLKRR